jgi:drug/metabolite transporter (DMT)-like permease
VLGLAGIAVLVGAPDTSAGPEVLTASVLLALMPVTWAIGTILQARELRRGSPLPLVAIGTSAGSLFLLPFAAAQAGEAATWDLSAALAFGYLVLFGSCVGLVLQLWLTRRLRPTTMMLAQVVIPGEALLIGALALGENITWRMVAGAALVVVAVALNAVAGGGSRPAPAAVASPAD